MLASYGGMGAQIVTPVRDGDGSCSGSSPCTTSAVPASGPSASSRSRGTGRPGRRIAGDACRSRLDRPDRGIDGHPDRRRASQVRSSSARSTATTGSGPTSMPVASIDPGEELELELRDGMDGALSPSSDSGVAGDRRFRHQPPLTGPIEVRGAAPGDVLVVTPRRIVPDGFGTTAVVPGFGVLGDLFDSYFLVLWEIADGVARSEQMPGIAIQGHPFLGCVAVAPSQELLERATARERVLAALRSVRARARSRALRSRPWSRTRHTRCGRSRRARTVAISTWLRCARAAALLLPVHVPGALLSIGDMHFAQGEGEVCGTAIEVAGDRHRGRLAAPGRHGCAGARRSPRSSTSRRPARPRVPAFRRSGSRSTTMAPTATWT